MSLQASEPFTTEMRISIKATVAFFCSSLLRLERDYSLGSLMKPRNIKKMEQMIPFNTHRLVGH